HAIETWVAYPEGDFSEDEPRTNGVKPVVLRSNWRSLRDVLQMCAFIRRRRIVALYLSDRPTWNIAYLAFRCVGVRRIVVHDHTSGEFAPSSGFRGMVKRLSRRLTWAMADQVVAVSEYVRQRKL